MRLARAFPVLSLVACTSSDPPLELEVCAAQHADGGVLACDEAFSAAPFVRLPPDEVSGSEATLYVAYNPLGNEGQLITREGKGYQLADDEGLIVFDRDRRLPAGLESRSYRFLYSIYEVQGTIGSVEGQDTFHATSARSVVTIASKVLDERILGAWEGTVTRCPGQPGPDQCTPVDPVPVRIELARLGATRPLLVWDDMTKHLDGHDLYTPEGVVANLSSPVELSDGSCAPALSELGSAAPWTGDPAIQLYRFPAMHAPGDYQLVLDYPQSAGNSGMGSILPASPASLIQTAPRPELEAASFGIHGAPNGFQIVLRRVSGGGGTCTPL